MIKEALENVKVNLEDIFAGIKGWIFITLIVVVIASAVVLIAPVEFDGKITVDANINLTAQGNTVVKIPDSNFYNGIELANGSKLTIGLNKIEVEGRFKVPMYVVILARSGWNQ